MNKKIIIVVIPILFLLAGCGIKTTSTPAPVSTGSQSVQTKSTSAKVDNLADKFDYTKCSDLISEVKLQEILGDASVALKDDVSGKLSDIPFAPNSSMKVCYFSNTTKAINGKTKTTCNTAGNSAIAHFESFTNKNKEELAKLGMSSEDEAKDIGRMSNFLRYTLPKGDTIAKIPTVYFNFVDNEKDCYVEIGVFTNTDVKSAEKAIAQEIEKNIK